MVDRVYLVMQVLYIYIYNNFARILTREIQCEYNTYVYHWSKKR